MRKLYVIALLIPLLTFSQAKNASSSFSTTTIAESSLFSTLANQAWPYKIDITSPSDLNNRAAQSLTINITSLPLQGANYRVVKSVANGNLYYGPGKALSLGSNSIRVYAVSFDRSIAIQFTSGDVAFDQLARDKNVEVVESVPLFPGCERVKKSELRKCFQEKLQRHIAKNFRYPEIAQKMGIQGRVYVQFIISKDGSITGIRTRGPDKNLENEAFRIISKLPKMTPGTQRGRPVSVPFSTPITFRLLGYDNFAKFEFAPIFPGCEEFYNSEKEKRKCFQEKIQQHIANNFQYPNIALRMKIQGIVYVNFIIDIDGSIKGIRTRGPHRLLEKEANRIISLLPGIVPGRNGDEFVRVPFSIPITFPL